MLKGQASVNTVAQDGRQKSKWDETNGNGKNPLFTGGQDFLSGAGAHATILSAAKAVRGYSAFVQERRKEAEDKQRSTNKKLERRSYGRRHNLKS